MSDSTTIASVIDNATLANEAPTVAPVKKSVHPVIGAYNALRSMGLNKNKAGDSLRTTGAVRLAVTARQEYGANASNEFATKSMALVALVHIATIRKFHADGLPSVIGGANPDKLSIGDVFASVLGFSSEVRKAKSDSVSKYVATLK